MLSIFRLFVKKQSYHPFPLMNSDLQTMSEEKANVINIKLRTQKGDDIHFRIKPSTNMDKVLKAFCDRSGLAQNSMRLFFDGARINLTQTASEVGLQDNDVLDVMEFQVGGAF